MVTRLRYLGLSLFFVVFHSLGVTVINLSDVVKWVILNSPDCIGDYTVSTPDVSGAA